MKKNELKSLMKGVCMGFAAIVAALLLLTNCGSAKSAGSASGDVAIQVSEYQLSNDIALLHLYRPATKVGVLVNYDLHLDNEVVFKAKYKTKTTVRLTSEGLKTLWGATEARTELPVNIQLGNEYFIRCDIGMGAFVGRPRLKLMDNKEGRKAFFKNSSKVKKSKKLSK
jgi:hypothetical protein